jgi:hypothetical protein
MKLHAMAEDDIDSCFPYPVTEVYKVARIEWKGMLKMRFSAKVLHVGIHHPGFGQTFIAIIVELVVSVLNSRLSCELEPGVDLAGNRKPTIAIPTFAN